jgi:regulator of replication initiation timing
MNNTNEGEDMMVNIGMMIPSNIIDKIERRKILRRLNTKNVFDFEYVPNENDQLELNFQEDDGFKFTFRKGKWVLEEWFGEHPLFEHKDKRKGVIESNNSRLKEVYKQYVEVLDENERDIVNCGWSNYRMSEKTLIGLMERRINGEKISLPDGYFPL